MKLNIQKFQGGGLMAFQPLPLATYPTNTSNASDESESESSSKKDSDDSAISKSLLKEMIGKGITNDVMAFKNMVDSANQTYLSMTDLERNTLQGKRLASIIAGNDWSTINAILRNGETFKNSIETVKNNKAYDELAVSDNGIVVLDQTTNRPTVISAEEFAEEMRNDKSKYRPITNAELANLRETNPYMANDTSSFRYLNNARGMEYIRSEIDKYTNTLGEISTAYSSNTFKKAESEEILGAISEIKDKVKDGIFSVDELVEQSSNSRQIKAAIEGAWQNLSSASRQVLKARAAKEGYDSNDLESAAKNYIVLMFAGLSSDSIKQDQKIKYEGDLTKGIADGTASGLTGEFGYTEALVSGTGTNTILRINQGYNTQYEVPAQTFGGYMEQGKITGPSMLSDMNSLMMIVDKNNISVGGNPVDFDKKNSIMYNGGDIGRAVLPYKYVTDEKTKKTNIVPDYNLAERLRIAQKEIDSLSNKDSVIDKERIYRKYEISTDGYGNLDQSKFKTFLMFYGNIGSEALKDNANKGLLFEEDDENTKKLFNQKYQYGNEDISKAKKKPVEDRTSSWYSFGLTDTGDIYKGVVAIPLTDTGQSARLADKNSFAIPKSETTPRYYRENAQDYSGSGYFDESKGTKAVSADNW